MTYWTGPARSCAWCAETYIPRHPSQRYCHYECNRLAARKFGAYTSVRMLSIFDRDGWECYLCLLPLDKALLGTSSVTRWSPVLDHVIPLSAPDCPGNVESNLRASHFGCNSRKANKRLTPELMARIRAEMQQLGVVEAHRQAIAEHRRAIDEHRQAIAELRAGG